MSAGIQHVFVGTLDVVVGTQLKTGLHINRKDRKHIVTNMYFRLYRYGLVSKSL